MDEKTIRTIVIVLLFAICIAGGYFFGRSKNNRTLREAIDKSESAAKRVEELDVDLKAARKEVDRLGKLQSKDSKTIERLEKGNIVLTELIGEQGDIINELKRESESIGGASQGITTGLEGVANEIKEIIEAIHIKNN